MVARDWVSRKLKESSCELEAPAKNTKFSPFFPFFFFPSFLLPFPPLPFSSSPRLLTRRTSRVVEIPARTASKTPLRREKKLSRLESSLLPYYRTSTVVGCLTSSCHYCQVHCHYHTLYFQCHSLTGIALPGLPLRWQSLARLPLHWATGTDCGTDEWQCHWQSLPVAVAITASDSWQCQPLRVCRCRRPGDHRGPEWPVSAQCTGSVSLMGARKRHSFSKGTYTFLLCNIFFTK